MSKDIMNWIEENRERSIQLENAKDGTESSMSKTSDETSSSYLNESKADDTSSGKSSEDEKRLQKQKKDILHRDIEKRRRDRINNSLMELRNLIPSAKTKLKCHGTTRSGRLQKAKLLELAVDYLRSISTDAATTGGEAEKHNREREGSAESSLDNNSIKDSLVVESAKQIYVTGYKAGFNHGLEQIYHKFSSKNEKDLLCSIDLKSISIPSMFLVSENDSNQSNDKIYDSDSGRGSRSSVDGIHTPSTVVNTDNFISTIQTNNMRHTTESPCFNLPPKLTKVNNENFSNKNIPYNNNSNVFNDQNRNNSSSINAKSFSEKSPILVSAYVLNETENQYYPTILPVEALLKSTKEELKRNTGKTYNNGYEINHCEDTYDEPRKTVLKRTHPEDPLAHSKRPHFERGYSHEPPPQYENRFEWFRNTYMQHFHNTK